MAQLMCSAVRMNSVHKTEKRADIDVRMNGAFLDVRMNGAFLDVRTNGAFLHVRRNGVLRRAHEWRS